MICSTFDHLLTLAPYIKWNLTPLSRRLLSLLLWMPKSAKKKGEGRDGGTLTTAVTFVGGTR